VEDKYGKYPSTGPDPCMCIERFLMSSGLPEDIIQA